MNISSLYIGFALAIVKNCKLNRLPFQRGTMFLHMFSFPQVKQLLESFDDF